MHSQNIILPVAKGRNSFNLLSNKLTKKDAISPGFNLALFLHIWFESNLIIFEIQEGLNTVLSSPKRALSDSTMGYDHML